MRIAQSTGYIRLRASLTCNRKQSQLLKCHASLKKKIRQWTKHTPFQKEKFCWLTSVMLCALFWILKMGSIGCLKRWLRNYHSTLCNIAEECRFHMMIWRCRPWFGSARSSSECSVLVQSSASYMNLRQPDIFSN